VNQSRLDHLVVVAPSLDEGASWCERKLGVASAAGGKHALMGTQNRLLRIATVDFPRAYLEVIAIDPDARSDERRAGARWFDMDDATFMGDVARGGARLAHFVVCVPDLDRALAQLRELGIDRGEALQASRMTPRGLLEWRIAVRPDGQRLFDGCLPTLIEWGDVHPVGSMTEMGVALQSLAVTHPQARQLRSAYEAIGLEGVLVDEGPARLSAALHTPRGLVTLDSAGG
jgi:hypothetical protein